ncbi:MAG: hypothetical protein KBE22_00095 [Candidatus Accumulibacter sp.]|nr:hypothetical protein [Accumulibacter sp.]
MWTREEEAKRLATRFEGVNQAKFARDHKLKGGQAMIYNHINALSPISRSAALIYAKAFGCSLEEISPRLAAELAAESAAAIEVADASAPDQQAPQQEEQITITEAAEPDDPPPVNGGLYAVENRTTARPPLTDNEQDVLDGYRVAGEETQERILGMCLVAIRKHGRREGERQKKA